MRGSTLNNLAIVLTYSALLITTVTLLLSVICRRKKILIDYVYTSAVLLIAIWLVLEILIHLLEKTSTISLLYCLRYLVFVSIPALLFIIVTLYYNIFLSTIKKYAYGLLICSIAISLWATAGGIYSFPWFGGINISALDPLIIEEPKNISFYVVQIFIQVAILSVIWIAIMQKRKLPLIYRFSADILLWCMLGIMLVMLIDSFDFVRNSGFDLALVGVCLLNIFFYLTIMAKENPDFLNVWQRDAYDHLNEGIMIFDGSKVVIDMNKTANDIFCAIGIDAKSKSFEQLKTEIAASDNAFLRNQKRSESIDQVQSEGQDRAQFQGQAKVLGKSQDQDLYITNGEYPMVYSLQRSSIKTKSGKGAFLILSEVTRNRLFIERLQDLAGVDALTGLMNRFKYEQILRSWDTSSNLPLSIIMGDVNDLKKFNDKHGHQLGDDLIKRTAKILASKCPSEGAIARVGGDEFVLLLKKHDRNAAEQVIQDIRAEIDKEEHIHSISIALGSATKYEVNENINLLYTQADERMYQNKRERVSHAK